MSEALTAIASNADAMARPLPPRGWMEADESPFLPAPEVEAWLRAAFVEPGGPLHNDEHAHLQGAALGVLWTVAPNSRHMQAIAGQAEMPTFQGNKWTKARQEAQMIAWFGAVPDFVLTFDATYASQCSDATWCALCEHELLHCGQAVNQYGGPRFTRDGRPVFAIRGHDVEEFVTVVRRYGVAASAGRTADLVAAGAMPPEFAAADIAACCGTCRG